MPHLSLSLTLTTATWYAAANFYPRLFFLVAVLSKMSQAEANKMAKKRRSVRSLPRTKKTAKIRIRDLKRRLQRERAKESVDASVISDLETSIAGLSAAEEDAAAARRHFELQKKYAQRYHKVKFFERRKVERKLGQVRRSLQHDMTPELRRRESELIDDLDYIKYYPRDKKYISLFGGRCEDAKTLRLRATRRQLALRAAAKARCPDAKAVPVSSGEPVNRTLAVEHDDFFVPIS